jgi:outer membrane protein W
MSGLNKGGLHLLLWAIFLNGLFQAHPAFSGEFEPKRQMEVFDKGRWSLQLISGSLFSSQINNTPVMDYWQTNLRFGYGLNQPTPAKSILRGNFEAILGLSLSEIYIGPGSYVVGLTALLRYNFVQPGSRLIPYFQAGSGLAYTDAYNDNSQDAIGQALEFTPQASVGFRYLIQENWSLDAEGMYHHISNGGLAKRNAGINAFGGFLGLTYFFDGRRK